LQGSDIVLGDHQRAGELPVPEAEGKSMGKAKDLAPDFEPKAEPPDDPLFITLFPNPDDGSVTVVEPPVMVDLAPNHRRQIYTSCITALEEMIQGLSPLSEIPSVLDF
jgi:hypothetical protein